jgi:hypothetical protein
MDENYEWVSLGLVPRKSLGVRYYSVALLVPVPEPVPADDEVR